MFASGVFTPPETLVRQRDQVAEQLARTSVGMTAGHVAIALDMELVHTAGLLKDLVDQERAVKDRSQQPPLYRLTPHERTRWLNQASETKRREQAERDERLAESVESPDEFRTVRPRIKSHVPGPKPQVPSVFVSARPGEEPTLMETQGNALIRIRGIVEEMTVCDSTCACCTGMRQVRKIIADLERA